MSDKTVRLIVGSPKPYGTVDGGLWQHQQQAVNLSKGRTNFGLFFGMGAGKTRTAIEIVKAENLRRILVIMPKTLLTDGTWERQLDQYLGEPYYSVRLSAGTATGKASVLGKLKASPTIDRVFVFVNYESCWRPGLDKALIAFGFDALILDEAHRVKAAGSTVSRYVHQLAKHTPAAKRLALTGTPMPNSPLDLYGLYRFLDSTIFGTRWDHFRATYAVTGGPGNHIVFGYRNLDELSQKMATNSLHVETDDVVELPDAIHLTRYGELEPGARRVYDRLERDFVQDLRGFAKQGGTTVPPNTLVKMLRMQQITSGFLFEPDPNTGKPVSADPLILSTAKLELLADVIESYPVTLPGVVFCRFRYDLKQVQEKLRANGYTTSELSGERRELDAWKEGKTQILVVQMQSGSEGIDLTRAKWVVYYSKVHSYGLYQQSLFRVRRPGQTDKTTFVHLELTHTIDAIMTRALASKGDTLERILAIYDSEAV